MPEEPTPSKWAVELRSRSLGYFTWKGLATSKANACKAARVAYGATWAVLAGDLPGPPGAKCVAEPSRIQDGIETWQAHRPMTDAAVKAGAPRKRRALVGRDPEPAIAAALASDPATLRAGGLLRASVLAEAEDGHRLVRAAISGESADGVVASQTTRAAVMAICLAWAGSDQKINVGFGEHQSATLNAAARIGRLRANAANPQCAPDALRSIGATTLAEMVERQAIANKEAHDGR